MKLEYFYIKGFRRIQEVRIVCGDATFLIGENNIGKSSVLKAMNIFFSETNKLDSEDFFKVEEKNYQIDEIVLEAKFSSLPDDAISWRGFKGRIVTEQINGEPSLCIYYKKTFPKNGTVKREMKALSKNIKDEFADCKTIQSLIDQGINEEVINEVFGGDVDKNKNIPAKEKEKLELITDLWNYNEDENNWVINPGGIEGNISIRLPKFLLIPAESRKEDIEGSGGILQKTMKELFEEVRDTSENYKEAQKYLDLLAKELDPSDENKEFGKMIKDVNGIISGIFHDTKIHIEANLTDPSASIKPTFDVEMSSNVKTKPERQGMGSIRSTAFALLRYREKFVERKRDEGAFVRSLIIGFEEPEMYLHPNAANLMRDKIYELATASFSKIICTTHSPYMIDLSKKIDQEGYPKQVLNSFKFTFNEDLNTDCCSVVAFNTSDAYNSLHQDEKQAVKFIIKIDDNAARVFFCRNVIIIEGDTEEILIKETVNRLPTKKRNKFLFNYQVIKARGKATIISLVKYLKALSISPFVIHDHDTEAGAVQFNQPILEALNNDENKRFVVINTIEDILGYPEPTYEKPFKAFEHIRDNWGEDWQGVQENWRLIFENNIASDLFVEEE